jgi:hypothetical protein
MTYPAIAREIIVAAKDIIALGPGGLLFYLLAALGLWFLYKKRPVSAILPACVALATVAMLFPFRKQHHFIAPRYVTPIEPALWLGLAALAVAPTQRLWRGVGSAACIALVAVGAYHSINLDAWFTGSDIGKWLVGPEIIKLRDHKNPDEAVVYQPVVLGDVGVYYHLETDRALNYGLYDVPLVKGEPSNSKPENRPHPQVPAEFHAPATWLVMAMINDPTRRQKALDIINALAAHYAVPVDPAEANKHLILHRVLVLRFSHAGIQWQSLGAGEKNAIAVPAP